MKRKAPVRGRAERDELILANLDLPRAVVRARYNFPEGYEQETEGYLGLVRAAERWPGEGIPFRVYAWQLVKSAIALAVAEAFHGPKFQGRGSGERPKTEWGAGLPPGAEPGYDPSSWETEWMRFEELTAPLSPLERDVVYCHVILGLNLNEVRRRLGLGGGMAYRAFERAVGKVRAHVEGKGFCG